jgi:hypothetical protein
MEIAEKLRPAIVSILDKEGEAAGTGFFVSNCHILTCFHVIRNLIKSSTIKIKTSENKIYSAYFIKNKSEKDMDFAVLELEYEGKFPCLPISEEFEFKDEWLSIGFESREQYDGVPNYGRIIDEAKVKNRDFMHITLFAKNSVTGGDSGSPLFNLRTKKVNGLISKAKRNQAFAISLKTILKKWPKLAELNSQSEGLVKFSEYDYEEIKKYIIDFGNILNKVDINNFAGRNWLLDKVDKFLCDHDCGYFILEAKAGLGKTTFMAWLAKERGYIQHFVSLAPGDIGVELGLKNLAAQLCQVYELDIRNAPIFNQSGNFNNFYKLLEDASTKLHKGNKIVILVDGLDAAGTPEGQNVLGLPRILPKGIYFIVTQRPIYVKLRLDTNKFIYPLESNNIDNEDDVRIFLKNAAKRSSIAQILQDNGYTSEQFIKCLVDKSGGLWIYLKFIIQEIEQAKRSPLNLDALPNNLTEYYAEYWQDWRKNHETQWYRNHLPILATLTVAQEPLTYKNLINLSGLDGSSREFLCLLKEQWMPFLDISVKDYVEKYRFYHDTVKEFFEVSVDEKTLTSAEKYFFDEIAQATKDANYRISERYLAAWGGIKNCLIGLEKNTLIMIDDGYGLRHLAYHLDASGRTDDLHKLLALADSKGKNAWYEAKKFGEESLSYSKDIKLAWNRAEKNFNPLDKVQASKNINLQCRYALIRSSNKSIADNFSPSQLVSILKYELLDVNTVLAFALEKPMPERRIESLVLLVPHLPNHLKEIAIDETIASTSMIQSWINRDKTREELAFKFVTLGHEEKALVVAEKIIWEPHRARTFAVLLEKLSESSRTNALEMTLKTLNEIDNSLFLQQVESIISIISPFLINLKQLNNLGHPKSLLEIKSGIKDGDILSSSDILELGLQKCQLHEVMAGNELSGFKEAQKFGTHRALEIWNELSKDSTEEALTTAMSILDNKMRTETIISMIGYLIDETFNEVLNAKGKIEDIETPLKSLYKLPYHLKETSDYDDLRDELKSTVEALSELNRILKLSEAASHLPERIRHDTLKDALLSLQKIDYIPLREHALIKIAHLLPESLLETAIEACREIEGDYKRSTALIALASNSPNELKLQATDRAIAEILKMDDKEVIQESLMVLASNLPEDLGIKLKRKIIARVLMRRNEKAIAETMINLLPKLPEKLRNEAIRKTIARLQKIEYEDQRIQEMIPFAPYLQQKEKNRIIKKGLEMGCRLLDERRSLLFQPNIVDGIDVNRDEAEDLTGEMIWLISRLVKGECPEQLLEENLDYPIGTFWAALSIRYERTRFLDISNLAGLLPHLSKEMSRLLLKAIVDIKDEKSRAYTLEKFALNLADDLLMELLEIAYKIHDRKRRANILIKIASRLSDESTKIEVLKEIAELYQSYNDEDCRVRALNELAPILTKIPKAAVYDIWCNILHVSAERTRSELYDDLCSLTPIIYFLGGFDTVTEILCSIEDVDRYWT